MTLFVRQLPALYNGVSQQPAPLRLTSQAEEEINCYPTVVDGVRKRPPTQHVAKLSSAAFSEPYIHVINRDTTERYVVVIANGDIKVYDFNGVEKTVAFPGGKSYLTSTNSREGFACVSVADYTFVVNKNVTVAMGAVAADQTAQPSYYYGLNRQLGGADLGLGQQPQVQYLPNPSGSLTGTVQTFQDLPATPTQGVIYRVSGSTDSAFASYFVRRNAGVWEETVKPGLKNLITATSMPHALVRKGDGTFEFAPFSWAPRRVGDETTNPNPTFVGREIRDVFFYKNRLGFLVDENFIMSGAGDFGNFYRLTVTDFLVDQVIDSGVSTTKVSLLNFAVPFNNALMAFADQTQFVISANGATTAATLSADVATEYECSKIVRPEPIGSDVYFPSGSIEWATVWEYFVRPGDSFQTDAGDITAHVPQYIPAPIKALKASPKHDSLFALSAAYGNRVYLYKMYWQDRDGTPMKAQSSWSYWEFDSTDTVLNLAALDDFVYFVTSRADGLYLDRCTLQSAAHPSGLSFELFIDRRASVTGAYLSVENKTVFTIPYVYKQSSLRLICGSAFTGAVGAMIDPTSYEFVDATTVKVPGNRSAGPVWVGANYTQKHTFSEQFVTDQNGVAVNTGRLQLRSMTIYYVGTAYFRTEVDPYGDGSQLESVEVIPSKLAEFTGKTIGASSLLIGSPSFSSGAYTFQLYAPATSAKVSLVNDTPYAATFQKAEVEMFYFNRAKVK